MKIMVSVAFVLYKQLFLHELLGDDTSHRSRATYRPRIRSQRSKTCPAIPSDVSEKTKASYRLLSVLRTWDSPSCLAPSMPRAASLDVATPHEPGP